MPTTGAIAHDNTCKLVCLCGRWGIPYTGLSQLQGKATHKWIAIRLAEKGGASAQHAAAIICEAATNAPEGAKFPLEFLMAGWAWDHDSGQIQPRMVLISNRYDDNGCLLPRPRRAFASWIRKLKVKEAYATRIIGQLYERAEARVSTVFSDASLRTEWDQNQP